MLSVTPSGHKSRRLDSHQHQPVYKTGAFLSRATSASSTSARSRTPSASFGGWLLSQEHTRVVGGKNSRQLEPGAIVVNYFASSTFQYASLMNFDQLSIRTSCAV